MAFAGASLTKGSGVEGFCWRPWIRGGGILLTPLHPGWGVGFGVEGIC